MDVPAGHRRVYARTNLPRGVRAHRWHDLPDDDTLTSLLEGGFVAAVGPGGAPPPDRLPGKQCCGAG